MITYSAKLVYPSGSVIPALSYNRATHVVTVLTNRVQLLEEGLIIAGELSLFTDGVELAIGDGWEAAVSNLEGRPRLDFYRTELGHTQKIGAIVAGGLLVAREFEEAELPAGDDQIELIPDVLSFTQNKAFIAGLVQARFLATESGLILMTEDGRLIEA